MQNTVQEILVDDSTGEVLRETEISVKTPKLKKKDLDSPRFSPFTEWYQFNKEYTESMIWLVQKSPSAYTILLFLLDQMDKLNAVVCSYKVIQEALGMSQVTVARAVKILKENNFVQVMKTGTSNVYTINKKIAWSSWGTDYKYCKFEANILVSQTEQNEGNDDLPKLDRVNAKYQKTLSSKR